MFKNVFPGLGGLFLTNTCACVCGCTASDPSADDKNDDKKGEGVSPAPEPW